VGVRFFAHPAHDNSFPFPYIPGMTKAQTRTARFPQHIREDAFAYYCAGHTRAEVVHRQRQQAGCRGSGTGGGQGGSEMISDRNALFFRARGSGSSLPSAGAGHLLAIAWVSGGLCRGCRWVFKGFLRGIGGVVPGHGHRFSATNHPAAAISQGQSQASSLKPRLTSSQPTR